jgi:hypothetical protein
MYFIISYPRSGQHLIASLLEYAVTGHGVEYSYCEFYSCCGSIPCKKGSMFMKNHDVTQDIPITPENKYLVLYRKDPILQLEAYARYILKEKKPRLEETIQFIRNNRPKYDRFVQKWCHDSMPNVLVLDYYEFLASPVDNMKTIFHHFYPTIQSKPEIWDTMQSQTFMVDDGRRNKVPRLIEPPRIMNPEYYQRLQDESKCKGS